MEERQNSEVRSIAVLVLGLGVYFCWQFVNMSASLFETFVASLVSLVNGSSIVSQAVYLLIPVIAAVVAARRQIVPRDQFSKARAIMAIASCTLTLAGMAMGLAASAAATSVPTWIAALTPVLSACSIAYMLLYGEMLCSLSLRLIMSGLGLAHVVGFACALFLVILPLPLQLAIYFLLLPISCIAYLKSIRLPLSTGRDYCLSRRGHASPPWRLFIGLGCFGILIAYLTFFSEAKTPDPDELRSLIAGLVVSIAFSALALLSQKGIDLPLASRIVLPSLIVSYFVIFAFDTGQPVIEVYLAGATWAYFRLYFWTMLCLGSRDSSWPPLASFAAGEAVYGAIELLGSELFGPVTGLGLPPLYLLAGVALVAVLVATFLLNDRYLAAFAPQTGNEPFDIHDERLCRQCVNLATGRFGLTEREREICLLLIQEKDNEAIRNELSIAQSTLAVHLRSIYRKADVHSHAELVATLQGLSKEK